MSTIKLGGLNVVDARTAMEVAEKLKYPTDFWGRANSYRCPRGKEPGVAWILMKRGELASLDKNAFHKLKLVDNTTDPRTTVTLEVQKLCLVNTLAMNAAKAGRTGTLYLVHLEDKRRLMRFSTLDVAYNTRIPAPSCLSGAELYYVESQNGGTAWTWQTMLDDIWDNLPSEAGTAPTLPYSPDGTPEGWQFHGQNAWDALHVVLQKVGCDTVYDPFEDEFSYVQIGQTQTGLAGTLATSAWAKRIVYDYDSLEDLQLAHMPETIRVVFHRRDLYHGVEEDTHATGNWEMSPIVTKDHTTGVTGALSGSILTVYDDLPAEYDVSGTNTNSAALQTRADEVGENIENRIDVSTEPMRQVYRGFLGTILPGSQIAEVQWRNYGGDTGPDGMSTALIRRRDQINEDGFVGEHLAPPDFGRPSHPVWPRLGQPVQVDDGSSSTGATIAANVSGLFEGFVLRWTGSAYTQEEACWIQPLDLETGGSPSESTIIDLRQKDRYHGRLFGVETHSSDTRPLYLVRVGGEGGTYTYDVSADNGSTVTIDSGDTLDFDASDRAFSEAGATQDDRGLVVEVETDGGDTTIKRLKMSTDNTVAQHVAITGSFTGPTPVDVEDGTAKTITFDASGGNLPPIDMTSSGGIISVVPRNPFHTVEDSAAATQSLNYQDTLIITHDCWITAVTKSLTDVTLTIDGPPIGCVFPHVLAPVLDTGKYYMDDGTGSANTCWALMDGSSNASPGSGIKICDTSGSGTTFIIRGANDSAADADNTAYGRTALDPATNDEVTVAVDDHPDHEHALNTDACDNDTAGADTTEYQFATQHPRTGVQVTTAGGALTLDHTISLTNHQGTDSDDIRLDPPTKLLWFYERIQ